MQFTNIHVGMQAVQSWEDSETFDLCERKHLMKGYASLAKRGDWAKRPNFWGEKRAEATLTPKQKMAQRKLVPFFNPARVFTPKPQRMAQSPFDN